MRRLEDFVNHWTDKDYGWWPVLSFRPPKEQDIDNLVLLKLSPVFGSMGGLIAVMALAVLPRVEVTPVKVLLCLLLGWAGFFVLSKFTYAYFWNCRARRLRNEQASSR